MVTFPPKMSEFSRYFYKTPKSEDQNLATFSLLFWRGDSLIHSAIWESPECET